MEKEETQVVDSAETTTPEELEANESSDGETNTTSEGEATATEGEGEQSRTETPDQRRARIKRQYEREFGKQGKEGGQEGDETSKKEEVSSDERFTRLELKAEGITSKKAQDVVLQYIEEAKLIGKDVDVSTALNSMVVKEAIAEIAKKTSAPAPSKRTGTGASDSFEYWKAQARKGNWPRQDKEMMAKLKKARIFTS